MKVLLESCSNCFAVIYYVINVIMLIYMLKGALMTINKLVEFLRWKKS